MRALPLLKTTGALALAFAASMASAQFEKGDNVAGLMLGIGGHYGAYSSYSSQTPAIGLFYEKGSGLDVGPGTLGLGGFLGYKHLSYKSDWRYAGYPYHYDYSWSYTILGLRGAYHYNDWHGVPQLDTYGGLMLAYNALSFKDKSDYPHGFGYTEGSDSYLSLSLYLGGRYYFSDNFAGLLELGYGISYLNIGLAYKF